MKTRITEIMVAGLITDIPTCEELITRIVSEAKELVKSRLVGMV